MFWVKRLFKLGIPSSLEYSSRSFGMVLMIFVVSIFGTTVIAAYGIGARILSFIIIPAVGLAIATSVLVGNNVGAGKKERADKIVKLSSLLGFGVLTLLGVILFIFANPISAFFVSGEEALISMSTTFIRYMALTFGFIGVQMVIIGAVKAVGKTTTSMILAILHTLALFGLSYVLAVSFNLGELGIWIAYPVANMFALCFALYFYFTRKSWLSKELV